MNKLTPKYSKMNKLIPKYLKWILVNKNFRENISFIDVHINEFIELFDESGELTIMEITEFFSKLCNQAIFPKDLETFLGLVINIRTKENKIDWKEIDIIDKGKDTYLCLNEYLTPPSLYLLSNPLDLAFFGHPSIRFISAIDDTFIFIKTAVDKDCTSITLNFLRKFPSA